MAHQSKEFIWKISAFWKIYFAQPYFHVSTSGLVPALYLRDVGPLPKLLPVVPAVLDVGEEQANRQAGEGEVNLEQQQAPEGKETDHSFQNSFNCANIVWHTIPIPSAK